MKKFNLTITLILTLLIFNISISQSYKGLYVDKFNEILNSTTKKDSLLSYIKANKFNTLTFYNLHLIDFNSNVETQNLKDFINRAKSEFGVTEFVATAENFWFFENKIIPYNQQANFDEKFTSLNLEFEFWVPESVSGYYCSTYLQPNGYSCDENGAFQFYMNELNSIYTLAQNNQLKTEVYLGWFNQSQADLIKQKCDRILLSNYNQNPENCFDYSLQRLQFLGNSSPTIEVATLFSGENEFLHTWLVQNNYNLDSCYNILITDFNNENASWKNNIDIIGHQWFTYTKLPYYLPEDETNNYNEFTNHGFYFTNPVYDNCVLFNYQNTINELKIFDSYGNNVKIYLKENKIIDMSKLQSGLYFLKYCGKTFKIIKI